MEKYICKFYFGENEQICISDDLRILIYICYQHLFMDSLNESMQFKFGGIFNNDNDLIIDTEKFAKYYTNLKFGGMRYILSDEFFMINQNVEKEINSHPSEVK